MPDRHSQAAGTGCYGCGAYCLAARIRDPCHHLRLGLLSLVIATLSMMTASAHEPRPDRPAGGLRVRHDMPPEESARSPCSCTSCGAPEESAQSILGLSPMLLVLGDATTVRAAGAVERVEGAPMRGNGWVSSLRSSPLRDFGGDKRLSADFIVMSMAAASGRISARHMCMASAWHGQGCLWPIRFKKVIASPSWCRSSIRPQRRADGGAVLEEHERALLGPRQRRPHSASPGRSGKVDGSGSLPVGIT